MLRLGVSARDMMAALIAGERDPKVLADLARGSMRGKTGRLEEANMQVTGAAVLAATRLRRASPSRYAGLPPWGTEKAERWASGIPNEG